MKSSISIARIKGIDVRVHVTFALIVAFGALLWPAHGLRGAVFGAALMLLVFACVLLHELGHSLVAQRLGLEVRDVVLFPLGGIATIRGTPRRPWHEVAIAAAGPAVNGVLAGLLMGVLAIRGDLASATVALPTHLAPSTTTLLLSLFGANVALALFNLLPIFPLDGGRILRALLAMRVGRRRGTEWAAIVGLMGAASLFIWALLELRLLVAAIAVFLFLAAARERRSVRLQPVLNELSAEDIAELPNVELSRTTRIGEAARLLLKSGQRVLPVVDDDRVVGLVTREALTFAALDKENRSRSVMVLSKPAVFVEARQPADTVLAMLEAEDTPAAVVMSDSIPIGLVTPEVNERAEVWAALQELRRPPDDPGALAKPNHHV